MPSDNEEVKPSDPTVLQNRDDSTILRKSIENSEQDRDLENMRALAGKDIVENITGENGRNIKLLYLTNSQAREISRDDNAIKVMIEKLCGKRNTYLIIDLVHSWGFRKSTRLMDPEIFKSKSSRFCAGLQYDTPPFGDFDDELETLSQLDHFMERVLIPLAEETQAIIICNAVPDDCALSDSFLKTVEQMSSKWGGSPPFEIVAALKCVDVLYNTPEKKMWPSIMEKSKAWKKRHGKDRGDEENDKGFLKLLFESTEKSFRGHDLSWGGRNLLIVEGLDTETMIQHLKKSEDIEGALKAAKNVSPFSSLMTSIIQNYGADIPCVALKTGATVRSREEKFPRGIDTMSLQILFDRLCTDTRVICLDIRKRNDAKKITRQELKKLDFQKYIKEELTKGFNVMWGGDKKRSESLDCSMLAFLKSTIDDWVDPRCEENENTKKKSLEKYINELIEKSKKSKDSKPEIDFVVVSKTFAKEFFLNVYRTSPHLEIPLNNDETYLDESEHVFEQEIYQTAMYTRKLLTSDNFHGLNIWSQKIHDDLRDIVLGGKGRKMSLEGLKVLRDVLNEINTANLSAGRFKWYCNIFILIQLFLSLMITTLSVWNANSEWVEITAVGLGYTQTAVEIFLQRATLVSSLLLSIVVAVDAFIQPRKNWLVLRNAAVTLESTVWQFRMREGDFKENIRDHNAPEENLKKALFNWQSKLSERSSSINIMYKGLNEKDEKKSMSYCPKDDDDHYSSITGDEYLKVRVEPLKKRYQSKIRSNVLHQYTPQILIASLGAIIAFISELGHAAVVAILIAFGSVFSTWVEFRDYQTKSQLYMDAIAACKVHETKWNGLSKLKGRSKTETAELVIGVEDIVRQVMAGWSSAIAEKKPIDSLNTVTLAKNDNGKFNTKEIV